MAQKTRVLALQRESHVAPGVSSLSVAARVTEVLDYLQFNGTIDYTSISENDSAASNGVAWADAVVLSKHSSESALTLVRQARRLGKKVIYDLDDWIFSFPQYSGGKHKNGKTGLIFEILMECDAITVANHRLQHKLKDMLPNTHYIPNGMWVEKYVPNDLPSIDTSKQHPRIVFTNADLIKMEQSKELLLTALQIFFIRNPEFVLDFYGDPFPEIVSLPFLHFTNRMPYEQYIRSLISGQYIFAITPLGADEDPVAADFNSCKNPFKYLNYGTAGIPGIYSASPIYTGCIEHQKTGLIVENDLESWSSALEQLAFDAILRDRMRKAAFEDIRCNHHIKTSAFTLERLFH